MQASAYPIGFRPSKECGMAVPLVLPFLCLLVLLSGCGNDPYRPEGGKMIGYAALGEDPRTLDPAQVSDTVSAEILDQIYDSLYENAYLPRPYKVEPAIASGYPEKRIFYEEVTEKGVKKTRSPHGIYLPSQGRRLFSGRPLLPWWQRQARDGQGRRLCHQEARRPEGPVHRVVARVRQDQGHRRLLQEGGCRRDRRTTRRRSRASPARTT